MRKLGTKRSSRISVGDVYGLSVNLYYDREIPSIRGVNVMKASLDQLDAATTSHNQLGGNQLHVMIGEHAHTVDLDQNNQPIDSGDADFAMQWQGAVATADFLMMLSNLDYLGGAHFLSMAMASRCGTRYGSMGTTQGNPLYTVMPTAKLYETLATLALDEALAVTTTSPASLDGEVYSVRSGAISSDDDSLLTLILVNRDSQSHDVDVLGLAGYAAVSAELLTASGPLAETIDIGLLSSLPNGGYVLPGLSIAIVQFQAVPEPASGALLSLAVFGHFRHSILVAIAAEP